jgi:hypothetical protein
MCLRVNDYDNVDPVKVFLIMPVTQIICTVKAGEPSDFQDRPRMTRLPRGYSHIHYAYNISQYTLFMYGRHSLLKTEDVQNSRFYREK